MNLVAGRVSLIIIASMLLSPVLTRPCFAQLQSLIAANLDFGKLANDLVDAVIKSIDKGVGWASQANCAVAKTRLSQFGGNLNLLAVKKLSLANMADRYVLRDGTVTWPNLKNTISDVSTATENLVTQMGQPALANMFIGPELGPPFRNVLVALDDRKEGLLTRMNNAGQKAAELEAAGQPVTGKNDAVAIEAEKLRAEALAIGAAGDALTSKISTWCAGN